MINAVLDSTQYITEVISICDEKGKNCVSYELLDIIQVDDREYALLTPIIDIEDKIIVVRYICDEKGNEFIEDIESDEEFNKVVNAWEESILEQN